MQVRNYNAGARYRYGFNGKENDNEVKGEGNEQDYGMRIYDPRLGRFLSVDPLSKSYPMLTSYQFASNSPIWGRDIDGLEFMPYLSSWFHIRTDITGNTQAQIPFLITFKKTETVEIDASNVPSVYKDELDRPLFNAMGVNVTTNGKYEQHDYPELRPSGYNNLPQNPGWTFEPDASDASEMWPGSKGTSYYSVSSGVGSIPYSGSAGSSLSDGSSAITEGIKYIQLFGDTKKWEASSDLQSAIGAFDKAVKAVDAVYSNPCFDKNGPMASHFERGDLINFVLDGTLPKYKTLNPSSDEIWRNLSIIYVGTQIINNHKDEDNWTNFPMLPTNHYQTRVTQTTIDNFKDVVEKYKEQHPEDNTDWFKYLPNK